MIPPSGSFEPLASKLTASPGSIVVALAVKLATGGNFASTAIELVVVAVSPSSSVTTSVTVYVPSDA